MSVSSSSTARTARKRRRWLLLTTLTAMAVVAVGCDPAVTPSGSQSGGPSASPAVASTSPIARASPTAEPAPAWRADVVPSTDHWATIVVVVDLVDGVDGAAVRAIREAVVDLMVSATDGTEIGVVRASQDAETLVQPVPMGTGRRDAIEAIWSAPAGGKRDMAAALARAATLEGRSQAPTIRRGILVIATGADDSVGPLGRAGAPDDVHVVTYGAGADEPAFAGLAQASGGLYGHADEPIELRRRVADVRRELEDMSLVSTGVLQADGSGRVSTPVGIGADQIFVRFAAYGVPVGSLTITNADGATFAAADGVEDVRVAEFAGRVSIGIGAASAGTWQLALRDLPAGQSVPYDVETFFSPYPDARGQADLDAAEGMTIGYMDGGLPSPAKVSATLLAPDGTERTVDLADHAGEDTLVCCIGNMLQVHLPGPIDGGPYVITVRSAGGIGPTAYERAVRFGFFMWPAVDSDGDGIRDRVELRNGMYPSDRAAGEVDADADGLSMSRELGDLGTDPFDYDTDDGGEGDGAEVAANRDPLDPKDDRVAASCVADAGAGDSDRFKPQTNAPRAPALEALLPDSLLGEALQKASVTGPPTLHSVWPGSLLEAFVECTGGFPPTLQVAYAWVPSWGGTAIMAVRIERSERGSLKAVPAQEIADVFLHRLLPGNEDELGARPFELDGRHAMLLQSGVLIYANEDVLFMTMGLAFGDCFTDCGVPPDMEELATALLPKLPGPSD